MRSKTRSHGPPWECRLRRSASVLHFPKLMACSGLRRIEETQSVDDGIPTQSVGTR